MKCRVRRYEGDVGPNIAWENDINPLILLEDLMVPSPSKKLNCLEKGSKNLHDSGGEGLKVILTSLMVKEGPCYVHSYCDFQEITLLVGHKYYCRFNKIFLLKYIPIFISAPHLRNPLILFPFYF
jgi:hypothetical protein